MIDLIIPYYNNKQGLMTTLQSIHHPDLFYITLIDDCSTEYPAIFPLRVNQVLRYNQNHGPGYARQFGLDRTHNEWVMFLDTGDVFISSGVSDVITAAIENYPDANVISFSYIHNGEVTKATDNRMHGKIYKRSFLKQYDITFAPESSYMDEDVGFNRTCRLCTDIVFIDNPIIRQIKEPNSLTQKDNSAALYRDQTHALSLVTIHSIEICRKHNIDVNEEINSIAVALYYWFIRTAAERPQYLQEAWSGAKIFYDQYFNEIKPQFLFMGNSYIKECLKYQKNIQFQINILRFAKDIHSNNEIPKLYRGERI